MIKNLMAILFGLFMAGGLLLAAEIFFRLNLTQHWLEKPLPNNPQVEWDHKKTEALREAFKPEKNVNWRPLYDFKQSEELGKEGIDYSKKDIPTLQHDLATKKLKNYSKTIEVRTKATQSLVYSAIFNYDEHGRRITPTPKNHEYNILMMGDSFTLGEGVDDQMTAAYQLGLLRKNAKVQNLGVPGGGAGETLFELKDTDSYRLADIPREKKTILLYTYIDDHLDRILCRSLCVSGNRNWLLTKPFYEYENGIFQYRGSFGSGRKFLNSIYEIINESQLLKFFNIVIPASFSQRHFDFFANMTKAIETSAKTKWPNLDFYLVLYPSDSAEYGDRLEAACKKLGIKVLNYSRIDAKNLTADRPKIAVDYHPSPVLHWVFARMLDQDLPKY